MVLIILGVVWILFPKDPGIFPLDDAYIHLNYIKNLAETGALSFNPGELSTGTSSPLWVALIAPFYKLGFDPYWTVITLSFGLLALVAHFTGLITRITTERLNFSNRIQLWCPLVASLLIILNGNLMWLSLSGMETMLFIMIGLLALLANSKWGFRYRTGAICALLTLTHPSGISLPITLIVINTILGSKSGSIKGLITYILVLSPYLLFTFLVNGNIFPTTGKAKTLTYVNSGLDIKEALEFTWAFVEYQKFLPHHAILPVAISTLSIAYLIRKISSNNNAAITTHIWPNAIKYIRIRPSGIGNAFTDSRALLTKHLLIISLLSWGIVHFAMYASTFRILLHHTRYLAIEYVVWAVVGSILIAFLHNLKPRGIFSIPAAVIALTLATVSLFTWGTIYLNNTKHVQEVYIRMSDAISDHTPEGSRIAAFDIGVIGFLTDREIIDLGGVTSSDAHACLKARSCGQFLKRSKADYVVYSRNPDVDIYNSLYLAEYQGPQLLKQKPLVYFSSKQYEAPTLTHSYRLDLYQINGWFPKTPNGIREAFAYDGMAFQPLWIDIDDCLQLVGYWMDHRVVQKITHHPLFVNFNYFFKTHKEFDEPYWVHMVLTDSDLEEIYMYEKHIPTHNILKPSNWPVGQVIKDHHVRIIPDSLPQEHFKVLITVTQSKILDWANPHNYQWIDIGEFENRRNTIAPISW